MPEYRLFETSTFQKDLRRLGPDPEKRLRRVLERRLYLVLRATPREVPGAARLRDWEPPTWRLRLGSWRVFYEIDAASIVFLTAAEHRKDAYR